jgi:hypothetical protein
MPLLLLSMALDVGGGALRIDTFNGVLILDMRGERCLVVLDRKERKHEHQPRSNSFII